MTSTYQLSNPQDKTSTDLPLVEGTLGIPAVDVRGLNTKQGVFAYDPGYTATVSCDSNITFIDGDNGKLLYRGYSIEDLAEHSNFLEACFLLLNGELPNKAEMDEFRANITHHTMLNQSLIKFYDGFHYDAHPMAVLLGVVGSLSAFYHDTTDITNPEHRKLFAQRMIAKMPTIAAAAYKHAIGQPKNHPLNHLDYSANLLHMMFAVPSQEYEVDEVAARALDVLFLLHADHEQNASATTVRTIGSTGANPYAAIAGGIAALWGPAHGGANEAVLNMLVEIGDVSNVPKYVDKAKDKQDEFRLMGFGHRVYKHLDPRAKVVRSYCHEVLEHYGMEDDPLFEIALELENKALKEDYFIDRGLYPNVDFYSGIIYRAIGIPVNMLTPMFAIARTVGWAAHWIEMMNDPQFRIFRPRQIYHGYTQRQYVAIDDRG